MIPIDQDVREKVLTDQCNQIIHAGAGTGKTTLIVEKYLALIEQGVAPEKIVAITFTHASADELKERIAFKYAQKFPDQPALLLAKLPINTIHGFARSIIRNQSLQLGYLPSFISSEEQAIDELRQHAATQFIPMFMKKNPNLFIWSLLGWVQSHHIQSWLILLSSKGRHVETTLPTSWQWNWQPIFECIQNLTARLKQSDVPSNDSAATLITGWQDCLSDINPDIPFTWASVLEQKPIKPDRKGNQKNWGGKESLSWVRQELQRLAQAIHEFQLSLSDHLIQTMDAMNIEFGKYLSDEKKKKNWMEPDEQLTHAAALLTQEPIWKHWRNQVDYVFIDEFQDTDPIQTTMIWRLLAQEFPGHLDWSDITLRPKSLTVVGDPQQSIYRFRGASVEIFDLACASIETHSGQRYTLSQNFRSTQGVLDFVNHFFQSEPSFVSLYAVPNEQAGQVQQVHVHPCLVLGENIDSVDELRAQEAHVLHAKLEQFLQQHTGFRPNQCALLLPTLKHASIYKDVFEQSMPVHIHAKRGQPNVLLDHILDWLRVLRMPWQPIAAWHAFRLPWTHQSMQTLVLWHQQMDGLALHKSHPDIAWQTIQQTIEVQTKLLQQSCFAWSEYFTNFYRRFYQAELTISDETLLQWLVQQAYIYDTNPTQNSFITHLEQTHELKGIASSEAALPKGLQIMTMHQSKGLEFPMVLLGDLASKVVKPQYLYQQPYPAKVELAFNSFRDWLKTPEFESLALSEKKALVQEKKRLLYVAMTRAEQHLMYPSIDFSTRGQTFYDFFTKDLDL